MAKWCETNYIENHRVRRMIFMTDDIIKVLLDSTSVGVTIASFANILPAISAFLAIVWILIRIFETRTVQDGLRSVYEVFLSHVFETTESDNNNDSSPYL